MPAIRQFLHGLVFLTHQSVTGRSASGRVVFRGCTCGKVFYGQHGIDSVKALLRLRWPAGAEQERKTP